MCSDKKIVLIDLDETMVDLTTHWIEVYNRLSGESIRTEMIRDYQVGLLCKNPKLLYDILNYPNFFYDLEPMPNAIKYFDKILAEPNLDTYIVTQLPRRCDQASKDKRRWLNLFFPQLDISKIIFAHHKELVRGDVLFDDNVSHLREWKRMNPSGITCKIEYPYNCFLKTDYTFSKWTAWENFYNILRKL